MSEPKTNDPDTLKAMVAARARAAGFEAIAVTSPKSIAEAGGRLDTFLRQGFHGDMAWMAETAARRRDPAALWPEARSIVMLAMNYGPDGDPLRDLDNGRTGVISCYARGRDYHDVIKGKLKQIAGVLHAVSGADVKVFVDTAPVMEKPLAAAAGLGWQGKHTNLVSRAHGSWLFLGSIFTTADLTQDQAEDDHCGSCRRCLDVCPTDAFPAPYRLDARRCISYLTIEHKGTIDRSLRRAMGNRIYGCDDCLAVCPWNKFAQTAREAHFHDRPELTAPRLADLAALDDAGFRALFSKNPIKRIGRNRFVRNVMIAIGNSQAPRLMDSVRPRLSDDSAQVRGAAVWAASRLADGHEFAALKAQYLPAETDPQVRDEWIRA